MIKIKVEKARSETTEVEFSTSVFPGGEVHVRIADDTDEISGAKVTIYANVYNSEDLIRLIMLTDAVRRKHARTVHLVLPYVPYARQDRVCNPGEAHGIRVFCDMINAQNYRSVTITDPHSDVVGALLNNVVIRTNYSLVSNVYRSHRDISAGRAVLVSPDAGSQKKIYGISKYLGGVRIIKADKVRDIKTTEIVDTIVYADDLTDKTCIIVDDICDGGRTFIELAKKLREKNAKTVVLVVTHGIFSKGLEPFVGLIDEIYTSPSWPAPKQVDGIKFRSYNI